MSRDSTPIDVTVLGAGIFGLSVAWSCARRGARVRVIDPRDVAGGASGGIVGALAPHTPENWNAKKQFQFESLMMAEDYWREISERGGADPGYARLGRIQSIADPRALQLARDRAAGAATHWKGEAVWRVERGNPDWAPVSAEQEIVFDDLSARIHPKQACLAMAAALRAADAQIVETGAPSGRVVHATGYEGLLEMSRALGQPVGNGVKGQALLLRLDRSGAPQIYADGVHIVPHGDGTVAIGSTSERDWDAPASPDAQLEGVLSRAVAHVPQLAGAEIVARWAGVRPRARSRAPMLGVHPQHPDAFVANGGFKIGFGMAPKLGEVMADLILEGRDEIPDDFRVEASLR